MKSVFKPVLLAALLATAGVGAFSQIQAMGEGDACRGHAVYERMGHKDPAWRQARMEKRAAELKAALKLSPPQEGAWASFAAAMKPPAALRARHQSSRAGLATLPTPERIDKVKALHTQHAQERMAVIDQRGEATKAFYATLTVEQKKVFDDSTLHHFGRAGRHGGHGSANGPIKL